MKFKPAFLGALIVYAFASWLLLMGFIPMIGNLGWYAFVYALLPGVLAYIAYRTSKPCPQTDNDCESEQWKSLSRKRKVWEYVKRNF